MNRRPITYMEIFVDNVGKPEDYIGLPVIKDGVAIGVVSDAVCENWKGYKLTLTIWLGMELTDGKPSAIMLDRGETWNVKL